MTTKKTVRKYNAKTEVNASALQAIQTVANALHNNAEALNRITVILEKSLIVE